MYIDLEIMGIDTPEQGYVIREAVEMTLVEYLPDNIGLITVNVEVALADDIGAAYGLCDEEDDKEFTIYLNKDILDDDVELFKTVAHECVHIKQYVMKELVHGSKFSMFYKDVFYDKDVYEYDELPWEIEAKKAEEQMFWQYEKRQQSDT